MFGIFERPFIVATGMKTRKTAHTQSREKLRLLIENFSKNLDRQIVISRRIGAIGQLHHCGNEPFGIARRFLQRPQRPRIQLSARQRNAVEQERFRVALATIDSNSKRLDRLFEISSSLECPDLPDAHLRLTAPEQHNHARKERGRESDLAAKWSA